MSAFKDLTGMKFGKLEVLEVVSKKPTKYKCKCDCDSIVCVASSHLLSGHTRSCGCLHVGNKLKDITGEIIHHHIVLGLAEIKEVSGQVRTFWRCKCINCGKEKIKTKNQMKQCKGCRWCELLPKGESGFRYLLNKYNYNAKKRGRNFY